MILIDVLQSFQEIDAIRAIECAVYNVPERTEVLVAGVEDKMMGFIVHEVQDPSGAAQDRFSLSPGNGGCQEACDLNILFCAKNVWYGDGIQADEIRPAVLPELEFQELPDFIFIYRLH